MRDRFRQPWPAPMRALSIPVAWMLPGAAPVRGVVEHRLLTHQSALTHWLMVGVLPPALALWRAERPDSA
ncbi:MAG: hypothetical protein QJR07_20975 [Acetobacteraceae bacterium]|nr:hypothetical protein [Acetobacteraceae bacterium]